jgi:hypothetical protein
MKYADAWGIYGINMIWTSFILQFHLRNFLLGLYGSIKELKAYKFNNIRLRYLFNVLLFSSGPGCSKETLNQELIISYAWINSKKFLIVKQGLIYNYNLVQQIVMSYFIWAYGQHINMHSKFQSF